MNTIFTWQIVSVVVVDANNTPDGYVYESINWKYIGEYNSYTSQLNGQNILISNVDDYVPFNTLSFEVQCYKLEQLNNISSLQSKINIDLYNQQYTNTYRWYILGLETIPEFEGHQNFITKVIYRYNAINNLGYEADLNGQITFNKVPTPYVEYSNITEQDVVIWLDTYSEIEKLQENLIFNIIDKMNPLIVTLPLPWES